MVTLSDPQWVAIRNVLEDGDRRGLDILSPRWFTGLAAAVLAHLRQLPDLSLMSAIDYLGQLYDEASFAEIRRHIEQSPVLRDPMPTIRTLERSFNMRHVKEVIEQAMLDIEQQGDRFEIAERVVTSLSNVQQQRQIVDYASLLTGETGSDQLPIETGNATYMEKGIDYWLPGNLMTIAGDTGSYKTTTAVDLIFNALEANSDLHAYYFMKEQPAIEVWLKAVARYCQWGYSVIQKEFNKDRKGTFEKISELLTQKQRAVLDRFHVVDQASFNTPTDVAAALRTYAARHPRIIWALDYATRLDYGGRPGEFNAYYTAGLETLKNATLYTQSFGIIIAQLHNGWNLGHEGKPRRVFPTRAHIIWSSELKNLSSYILMLYVPGLYFTEPRDIVFHTFAKVRHTDSLARVPMILEGEMQQTFPVPSARQFHIDQILTQHRGD